MAIFTPKLYLDPPNKNKYLPSYTLPFVGTDADDAPSEDEEESEVEGNSDQCMFEFGMGATATKGSSVGCREGDDVDTTLLDFLPE